MIWLNDLISYNSSIRNPWLYLFSFLVAQQYFMSILNIKTTEYLRIGLIMTRSGQLISLCFNLLNDDQKSLPWEPVTTRSVSVLPSTCSKKVLVSENNFNIPTCRHLNTVCSRFEPVLLLKPLLDEKIITFWLYFCSQMMFFLYYIQGKLLFCP